MLDCFLTKCGLFYQAPLLFRKQRVLDNITEDLFCMLKCSRQSLHKIIAKNGLVTVNLWFGEDDNN